MNRLSNYMAWTEANRDLWIDFIRIYLGLGLLARGLLLITNTPTGFLVELLQRSSQSWLTTGIVLHYVMLAHFVGGLLLVIGFLTRAAAFIQAPILAGAVFFVHRADGLFALGQSLEFSALVLFLLLVIGVAGGGRLSLDHAVFGSHEPGGNHAVPST